MRGVCSKTAMQTELKRREGVCVPDVEPLYVSDVKDGWVEGFDKV